MAKCEKDHSYNGWRNYETWSVNLWLDNEESTYDEARRLTREAIEDAESSHGLTKKESAACDLRETLKDWVGGMMPALEGGDLQGQLLAGAFSEVDWYEIAEHYVNDAWESDDEESAEG